MSDRASILELSRERVMTLIHSQLKVIGTTLPKFKKWTRERRTRTLWGASVQMLLTMLEYTGNE